MNRLESTEAAPPERMDESTRARLRAAKAKRLHGFQLFGAEVGSVRITRDTLNSQHGAHRGRHLVVSFVGGDLIEIRPFGSPIRKTVSAFDIYRFAIEREATAARMERLRAQREKKKARLERLRLKAAEARLRRSL